MASIGYIGLGTMGRGMVANLLRAGHDVTVWNRTAERIATDAPGATAAGSIAEAVAGRDVVLVCLSDDPAVREAVLGPDGVLAHVAATTVVADMSTISPTLSDEEARAAEERGIRFLDAPVFGSKGEAAAGGLWVVVGGDTETVETVRPVLDAVAETVHHMGGHGAGARMKLVGNLVVAAQLNVLGEALALAKRAGLDLHAVLDVLHVTDFRSPIFDGVGPAVLAGDYSPSFALDLMVKDAHLIDAFAAQVGCPLPGLAPVLDNLEAAQRSGYGRENASALIKVIADRADTHLED
ncbi:MAG: 2-hydroxy-3-oxopropionate reductase [Cellulomonas sp. 73-145]|uniref:NAD(P)-dependent oxidoreductase n=1 Tax=Cellulomonas sp. 73-145 TaxID=1895739 RepID=UPI0009274C30|nr:NAD(P)-dependent oxidoreductase [Cellulomonas sp. 73-145]OJV59661.1 MAG: 2-hydroxy-3-oxopropionate reductase [Cellulomonas sp. 73-145]